MPSQVITQKMLDLALAKLRAELKYDFDTKINVLDTRITQVEVRLTGKIQDLDDRMTTNFSQIFSLIDRYMKRTNDWYQEQVVLKFQHDRLEGALVRKNVISEKEILS